MCPVVFQVLLFGKKESPEKHYYQLFYCLTHLIKRGTNIHHELFFQMCNSPFASQRSSLWVSTISFVFLERRTEEQRWCRCGWRFRPESLLFCVWAHISSPTGRLECRQGLLIVKRVEGTFQCLSWYRNLGSVTISCLSNRAAHTQSPQLWLSKTSSI